MLGFWTLVCFCSENKQFMFLELAFTPTPFDTQSVSFRCQSDLVKLLLSVHQDALGRNSICSWEEDKRPEEK